MITEWFTEKFVTPLCKYYTLESTLIYGLILVLAVIWIYKLLKKLKIKIDKNFFLALLPFIIYGGWTRALRDHLLGIYGNQWWWCSPPIYVVIFLITISLLLIGLQLEKSFKIPYYKFMIVSGTLLLLYNLSITRMTNLLSITIILSLLAIWALAFFGYHKLFPKKLSFENAGIFVAHLFDASSTFTALSYFGYYEQHVLPTFLINIFGPWIMFPLKIIVVYFVLHILDKEIDDKNMKNFLKIIIFILGAALGVRNFLTLAML
ncbi:MAG: DUF63 family protein [Nanoarchaeota archaeon]|nr:DUF63 family protein [Nanoarchaeota archaeon]MBU4124447.1 DUF63 family protein [Nanoarchaeota archaeon]